MNNVCLIGRLVADPVVESTPTGKTVAKFRIAVHRRFDRETTDFLDCVAWEQSAAYLGEYGSKGRAVALTGRIQVREWEAQDGTKRRAFEIVSDSVSLIDRRPDAITPATPSGQKAAEEEHDPFADE